MSKKSYLLLLIIIYQFLSTNSVFAQNRAAEMAFMHTDRSTYVAGEALFYKLYVQDVATQNKSKISSIAYIVLRSVSLNSVLKTRVKLNQGMASGAILLPDSLNTGVYELIAFTSLMKNFNDKLLFRKEIIVLNKFDMNLSLKIGNAINILPDMPTEKNKLIQLEKEVFGMREKVKVKLNNIHSNSNLSVSVYEETPLSMLNSSITETFNNALNADLKVSSNGFMTETKEKILSGRIVDTKLNKGVSKAVVLLSCVDSVPNLQYAVADVAGKFHFALTNYYNAKELYLTIRNVPEGQQWKIETDDSYLIPDYWPVAKAEMNADIKNSFIKSQHIFQINKTYNQEPIFIENKSDSSVSNCPQMYYNKPVVIYPTDFVSLNDFLEISVELLPQVRITKRETKYYLQVLGATTYTPQNHEAAIFLDGVFVDDINKIIGLGSEKIKKIELFNVERAIGNLIFQGIIAVTTKSNEIVRTTPAPHSARLKYDNYNGNKQFLETTVSTIADPKMPFVKQLLYWNPDLTRNGTANCNFEFYTSDNTAVFVIDVEGITQNGIPINEKCRIKVSNQLKSTVQ